ncbi:MAG TPA: DUF1127 domain-containing protein [Gammaproteobacteria bacterium]|nr:DUF1127 domain-containing protein [Gammaproteobacteria bacterium]
MTTHTHTLQTPCSHGGRTRRSSADTFGRLLRTLALWHERARQRRALAVLPDELLKDIGVSRADAMREAGKPFWKA